jgi:predicted RNA-binding protein with PUA-like domain
MARKRYWLMKTEPDTFSIDDLARVGSEPWNGVRNYQARNYMRDDMHPGDGVLIYHSSCPQPGVAGVAKVASAAYPDPTQFDRRSDYYDQASTPQQPRWYLVDIAWERTLEQVIGLADIKALPALADSPLVARGNRLSILPLAAAHWRAILALEAKPA